MGDTASLPLRLEPLIIEAAGEYRSVSVEVSHSGLHLPETLSPGPADWLALEASGFVEDEKSALAELDRLKAELEKKCRRVTVSAEKLNVLAGLSSQPLALDFIKKWEEEARAAADGKRDIYELARIKGLAALKEILESRK
jgi:hypothetical protein